MSEAEIESTRLLLERWLGAETWHTMQERDVDLFHHAVFKFYRMFGNDARVELFRIAVYEEIKHSPDMKEPADRYIAKAGVLLEFLQTVRPDQG